MESYQSLYCKLLRVSYISSLIIQVGFSYMKTLLSLLDGNNDKDCISN